METTYVPATFLRALVLDGQSFKEPSEFRFATHMMISRLPENGRGAAYLDSLKICREAYMSTPPVAGERYEFVVRKWKGSEPVVIGTLPRVVVVAEFVDIAKSVFNEREIVELKTKDGVETRPTLLRFLGGFDMKGRTFAFSCLTGKGEKVEKEDDDSDTDESDDEEGEKEEETAPKGEIVGYSLTA